MLYKTIFSYLKDMNIITEEYSDSVGESKFRQYDYNKNEALEFKEFSDMLKNDVHCRKWMVVLGFKEEDQFEERVEKPDSDPNEITTDEFAENVNEGDQAGSTPSWIKTIEKMAPTTKPPPKEHNTTPSNNLEI